MRVPGAADNGPMSRRLRSLLDGAGWSVGLAGVLFALALLAVVMVAQSPEAVLWTGHHAVGTERGGLVLFRWQGHPYAIDVPGYGSAKAVDVYFDPADPAGGMAGNLPDRMITGSLVGLPLLGGLAVLLAGLTRRWRWAQRQRRDTAAFGRGLDPAFVARQLQERRGGQPGR